MTFALGKLAALVNDAGFSSWYYDTDDEVGELAVPGYFNDVRGMLRRGDLIFASCLDSGVRTTAPFLVSSMSHETSRVERLLAVGHDTAGPPAYQGMRLGALTDVSIGAAQRDEVLTYNGQLWVAHRNPGADGDVHAVATGNPHRTSASEIGAVPVSEKEQPNGVATLDATGRVPLAQMPGQISTSETFYGGDVRFAGGLRSGNPAAANDAALDALFAALRESSAERKYVEFPAGTFDISGSIAPSGKSPGPGDAVGLMTTFEFKNCDFVVNGEASDYTEMTLDHAGTWSTFDHFSVPTDGGRTYRFGNDLFDTAGRALRKHVVFDIRNCGGLSCLGRLSITRNGSRIPHLVAFGSSGGDVSAFTSSGMQDGSVAHLRIENFAIGMMALRLTSAGDKVGGTWNSVSFDHLLFESCGRCMVIEADHCTGMSIARLALMGDQTSYLSDVHAISVGSCALTCNGATPLPGELSFKLLEIADAEINIATLHGRSTRRRGGFSLINVCNFGLVRIGTIHHENNAASELQSGCLITMVSADNGDSCTQASVQVGGAGAKLEKASGFAAIIGIAANSADARRLIWTNVSGGDADDGPGPVRVIRDYGAAAVGTATTKDRIHGYSASGGYTVRRLVNGALVDW